MTRDKSIGWADETLNIVTGCRRGCTWCEARETHHRFERIWGYDFAPMFHRERLKIPYGWRKPRVCFLNSMGEVFSDEINDAQVNLMLHMAEDNPRHRFLILTQRTERIGDFHYPSNVWVGVTVRFSSEEHRIWRLVAKADAEVKFVSFEPLMAPMRDMNLHGINWVIIGGRRKIVWPRPLPKFVPPHEWVEPIIAEARRVGAAVFLKQNLEWPEVVREWPSEKC